MPPVQFDWTGSGLTNPLEGKYQPISYITFIYHVIGMYLFKLFERRLPVRLPPPLYFQCLRGSKRPNYRLCLVTCLNIELLAMVPYYRSSRMLGLYLGRHVT